MAVTFKKYFGKENSYLVFDVIKNDYEITAKKAKLICDCKFGVGGDGILMGPYFEEDGIHMRIFQKDGSSNELSEEAMCVFARYLKDNAYVQKKHFSMHANNQFVTASFMNEEGTHVRLSKGKENFVSDETMCEDEVLMLGDVGYVGTSTLGYEFLAKLRTL